MGHVGSHRERRIMYSSDLFSFDPRTNTLSVEVSTLLAIRGPNARSAFSRVGCLSEGGLEVISERTGAVVTFGIVDERYDTEGELQAWELEAVKHNQLRGVPDVKMIVVND